MKDRDITYFTHEKNIKNPIFFDRFPKIKYEGLKILDFGCGHGAISIDLAIKGAEEIVGIDLNSDYIEFANENLKTNFSNFIGKITFKCIDFQSLEDDYFDLIVSKASFEHVIKSSVTDNVFTCSSSF